MASVIPLVVKGGEIMIKEYRQAAGLTQKQFSELFEIPIDVIKAWDSGRRKPPIWAEKLIIKELERIKEQRNKSKDT